MNIRVAVPFYSEFEEVKKMLRADFSPFLDDRHLEETGKYRYRVCGHVLYFEPRQGCPVQRVRNALVGDGKRFPVPGLDMWVFCDSDVSPSLKTILRGIDLISFGHRVVTFPTTTHDVDGTYNVMESDKPFGCIKRRYNTSEKGKKEVDLTALGLTFISKEVFEEIGYPWFRHYMLDTPFGLEETTEDIGFCCHIRGRFPILCDFDYPVPHKKKEYDNYDWKV